MSAARPLAVAGETAVRMSAALVTQVAPVVADQLMASGGLAGGHRAGHGHHRAAQFAGVPGGVQCAAAQPRLDDHGARGQGGDDPVAGQEPAPWRELGRVGTR